MVLQQAGEYDPHFATPRELGIGFLIMALSAGAFWLMTTRNWSFGQMAFALAFIGGWWIAKFGFYTPLDMLREVRNELRSPRP